MNIGRGEMGQLDRAELSAQGTRRARELREDGVELVAMTFVDNSGILRTKAVPVGKLASAAAWGVGASNSFDFFLCPCLFYLQPQTRESSRVTSRLSVA